MPVKMVEKEDVNVKEVRGLMDEIIQELSEYLMEFIPERMSFAKHSVMGPVGKLISILESGRFENKDALIGYVINVHNNTSRKRISSEGVKKLENALSKLEELRAKVNVRMWVRLMREIDYAVYKNKMERIVLGGDKDGNA